MKAVSHFKKDSTFLLIIYGADKTIENIDGKSAKDLIGSAIKRDEITTNEFKEKYSTIKTLLKETIPNRIPENDENNENNNNRTNDEENNPKLPLPPKKSKKPNKYPNEDPGTVIETTTKRDLNPAPVNFRNKTRRTQSRSTLGEEMQEEINSI